jgi:hypothetical protein
MRGLVPHLLSVPILAACPAEKTLDRAALLDPERCKDCHPDHYREWSGSMHAYAAEDPVFRAMNARGQRETQGALGDFCVKCHAPMAVREGATTDGQNLDEVPAHLKGVTCFFCHSATGTTDDHNGAVELAGAEDLSMRGGLPDPKDNEAHEAEYSELHDRSLLVSSSLCGSCHDIVTPRGVHLERTFEEWRGSLFSHDTVEERQTCGACHMKGRDGVAAMVDGVPLRRVHDHRMVGVDIALTDFPERSDQQVHIQRELDFVLVLQICVMRIGAGVQVILDLENLAAGHSWPSGAAQDRRAWVEIVARSGGTKTYVSGAIPAGTAVASFSDPDLWWFGDELVGEGGGAPVHMFWEASDYRSNLLPAMTALSPLDPVFVDPHKRRDYPIPGVPDEIEAKVHVRPIDYDVIDDLIGSGDLDASVRSAIPTFTLRSTEVVWRASDGRTCVPDL